MEKYLLCLSNGGYAASLEVRKSYEFVPDARAADRRCIRIVDEDGEDYVYPENLFMAMEVSESASRALHQRAA
ncbi:MAG: hypothetical protein EPO42_07025 [Gallionellaceae bacterium]|nr:MAG: hypothetical protein EPO42_07025 [Gallionellaceae bacterium]